MSNTEKQRHSHQIQPMAISLDEIAAIAADAAEVAKHARQTLTQHSSTTVAEETKSNNYWRKLVAMMEVQAANLLLNKKASPDWMVRRDEHETDVGQNDQPVNSLVPSRTKRTAFF